MSMIMIILLQINGENVQRVKHFEAVQLFHKSKEQITLLIKKGVAPNPPEEVQDYKVTNICLTMCVCARACACLGVTLTVLLTGFSTCTRNVQKAFCSGWFGACCCSIGVLAVHSSLTFCMWT